VELSHGLGPQLLSSAIKRVEGIPQEESIGRGERAKGPERCAFVRREGAAAQRQSVLCEHVHVGRELEQVRLVARDGAELGVEESVELRKRAQHVFHVRQYRREVSRVPE
jgi:hypothetical protein